MEKTNYNKPFLSYQDQLLQLKQRGLLVDNERKATHILENISYFRLSSYWVPFLSDREQNIFKKNASIDNVFKLYCFDSELRKLVISELEKIEVAIRAKMIYILSEAFGPFWVEKSELFDHTTIHSSTISKIKDEYSRSDEEFLKEFSNKYCDPLPPSWMMMEITSFGTLSILYKHLIRNKQKKEIAGYFGLAIPVFESWLHCLVYLRNICAHHSRLWNRMISISPVIPRNPRKQWLSGTDIKNNRTFMLLCIIRFFLGTVNPHNKFQLKVKTLLNKYPEVDIKALGFPVDWEKEYIWI